MKITKTMRTLALAGIVLAVGAGAVCGRAETVAAMPAPTGYVDDYAGVVSAPAKTELEGLCREVHDKTKAQIFFVTVKTLDGEPVERFANELFAKWKIGEKKTDRGILLLLAIKDRKRWIEVGYGFEGILNDAKVGDIGREMVPALKASNYDEAARIGVDDVAKVIAADSNVTLAGLGDAETTPAAVEDAPPPIPDGIGKSSAGPRWPLILFPIIFFGGFGSFVALIIWNIRRGVRFGGGGSGSSGFGGDSGGSFGGDSGGSSDSFSGGDGGSSGGGGAGGDW
jgi:uncharacterized protein